MKLFNIPIINCTKDKAIELIVNALSQKTKTQINFINAHCINTAYANPLYMKILQNTKTNFADGVGMQFAASLLSEHLIDNVNGTDLYPMLIKALAKTQHKIYLLGAEPGIAEQMRDKALEQYPTLQFCGIHHGHFNENETKTIIDQINQANPDLLLVAMGVSKQELWIADHLKQLNIKVAIGVGGLFNFYSGKIPRAPYWMQSLGLEWLHRFFMEPSRLWKRYLIGNLIFLFRIIKLKFTK
jgi:N-acetylglucosaminyldiphosphoundecaprenol N-acetyl-beta-D-mannosaminyltransferase